MIYHRIRTTAWSDSGVKYNNNISTNYQRTYRYCWNIIIRCYIRDSETPHKARYAFQLQARGRLGFHATACPNNIDNLVVFGLRGLPDCPRTVDRISLIMPWSVVFISRYITYKPWSGPVLPAFFQILQIVLIILIRKENRLPTMTPLYHMMRTVYANPLIFRRRLK